MYLIFSIKDGGRNGMNDDESCRTEENVLDQ